MKRCGVKVVLIYLQGDQKQLVDGLTGADVVISALHFLALEEEVQLSTAAKEAGVQRYVPCFFATVGPRGVMKLRDRILLPRVPSGQFDYALLSPINSIFAGGEAPIALTDVRDIGLYVARIITDPSTINKKVFANTETKTQNQIFDLVEGLTGEKIERTTMSAADVEAKLEQLGQHKYGNNAAAHATFEYWRSWGIRGDNNLENAKYLGYLLAEELYPEVKGRSLETYVQEIIDQKGYRVYG